MSHVLKNQSRFYLLVFMVGVIAGCGALFFRELIGFFHNLFFYGQWSTYYDVLQHALPSRWGVGVILVPVVGAIFVSFLVKNFAPEAKGHGVPEVMDAIYYEKGRIRPIVAVIKSLASSITIGSGGSVGREGPIIQIGAAFGATMGQWFPVPDWQRITLIACGAGGGIAATFNAPFGGILFAVEIMLPEVSARTIIPVTLATAIATYISYAFTGDVAFIPFTLAGMSQLHYLSALTLLCYSILLGVAAALFIHGIYFAEDLFERLPGGYYLQHMLGMLMMGILIYYTMHFFGHYYVEGVGYATIIDVLSQHLVTPQFLIFLACLKMFATCLTLGSGGSGGVFSPLLFIGATLGGGLAALASLCLPADAAFSIPLGAVGGMAGIVGAATAAPLTAIIMIAELTKDYALILPLMVIVSIAYAVRRVIMKDSIYTLKLSRRGHHLPDKLHTHPTLMQ